MKRMGMVILALGLFALGARTQQAPAKSPTAPPAKAPAATAPVQTPAAQAPANKTPAPESTFKTQKEKVSYAIGLQMGRGVKAEQIDVDPDIVLRGIKDALSDAKSQMSEDELRQVIGSLQQEIRQKQMQAQQAAAAENKTKGDAFLADNAKKEGVVALPDGLQYKILTAGQGKKPLESDTVLCNYKGTFLDGTEFDSSERAGKPVPFEVNNVIPGFKEVLQMMPVGSKWQVFVPSNLAYGERGAGGVIGPNATLIFEVELVGIQDKQPASSGAPPAAGQAPANGAPPKQ
jgi:FKBP-type peptidyl-prolyl cis-trans isomerase